MERGGTSAASGAALTHGFAIAFYALGAVTVLAAVLTALIVEPKPAVDDQAERGAEDVVLEALQREGHTDA